MGTGGGLAAGSAALGLPSGLHRPAEGAEGAGGPVQETVQAHGEAPRPA